MSDRLSDIEARLQQIEDALRALNSAGTGPRLLPAAGSDARPPAIPPLPARLEAVAVLTLVGRTLMVLGGAYLLRALTESGRLPAPTGVLVGLAYTAAWFGAADRAGATRKMSGLFHGLAAVLIGLPLLWEASTHFRLFSPEASAVALAGITGLALAVAWHRDLQTLAGVAALGSLSATAVLVVATGRPLPFATGLVALGAATLWLSYARGWSWLRWPPALAANIFLAGLMTRASGAAPLDRPDLVIALLLLLLSTYAGPVAWRTLVGRRRVLPFEVIQVTFVLGIGLGGALLVAHDRFPAIRLMLGGLSLLAAGGSYAAAFGVVEPRRGQGANFGCYLILAATLALTGGAALLTGSWLVLWLAVLAVATTSFGARFSKPALSLHGAIFSVAAALSSGLLALSGTVWLTAGPWPPLADVHGVALAVAVACVAIPRAMSVDPRDGPPFLAIVSRLILEVIIVAGFGGIAIAFLGPLIAGEPMDAGVLAATKTVTLAVSALLVAAMARFRRFSEFGWLVYPVLLIGGVKLVVDDFRHSAPAALFVALAVYGAALIVAPRIRRSASRFPRPR